MLKMQIGQLVETIDDLHGRISHVNWARVERITTAQVHVRNEHGNLSKYWKKNGRVVGYVFPNVTHCIREVMRSDHLITAEHAMRPKPKPDPDTQDLAPRGAAVRRVNGYTKPEFIRFLQETLIPDLKAAGRPETALDFETAVAFMK